MEEFEEFLASDVHDSMLKNHAWYKEEDKEFEKAIAELDPSSPSFFEDIASRLPFKSMEDVKCHYQALVEDVDMIEAGLIELPDYKDDPGASRIQKRFSSKSKRGTASEDITKKGERWTQEEHRLFLMGLEKCGKGDWRGISRRFVVTRTPTQIASHAQKYFLRLKTPSERRRHSIHDIQNVTTTTDKPDTTISAATITASVPPAPVQENPLQEAKLPPRNSFPYNNMSNANNSQQETHPYLHYHSLTFPSPVTITDATRISAPLYNQMNLERTEQLPPLHNNLMINANNNWERGDGFVNNLPPAMASSAFPIAETTAALQSSTASSSSSNFASPTNWLWET